MLKLGKKAVSEQGTIGYYTLCHCVCRCLVSTLEDSSDGYISGSATYNFSLNNL